MKNHFSKKGAFGPLPNSKYSTDQMVLLLRHNDTIFNAPALILNTPASTNWLNERGIF